MAAFNPVMLMLWSTRTDQSANDGFGVDVPEVKLILTFHSGIGMDQHVSLHINYEDVLLTLPPRHDEVQL